MTRAGPVAAPKRRNTCRRSAARVDLDACLSHTWSVSGSTVRARGVPQGNTRSAVYAARARDRHVDVGTEPVSRTGLSWPSIACEMTRACSSISAVSGSSLHSGSSTYARVVRGASSLRSTAGTLPAAIQHETQGDRASDVNGQEATTGRDDAHLCDSSPAHHRLQAIEQVCEVDVECAS